MHEVLKPTYEYFDWNRNQNGLVGLEWTAAATACATGKEDLDVYNWPGSVEGY